MRMLHFMLLHMPFKYNETNKKIILLFSIASEWFTVHEKVQILVFGLVEKCDY